MFDAYHKWLGILPKDQPPNHYRLLSLEPFESDLDVIEGAADRQMGFVRQYQSGEHAAEAARLLNDLAAARLCLLKPATKASYDAKLRREFTSKESAFPDVSFPVDELAPKLRSQKRTKKAAKSSDSMNRSLMIGGGIAAIVIGLLATMFSGSSKPTRTGIASVNSPNLAATTSDSKESVNPQASNSVDWAESKLVTQHAGESVDLLKTIDLKRDVILGECRQTTTALIVGRESRIYLPTKLPEDYQLKFAVRREEGQDSLVIGFMMAGRQGMITLDGWNATASGLYVDGRDARDNCTTRREKLFVEQSIANVVLTAHPGHLHVTFDERTIIDWHGNPSRLFFDVMTSRESPFLASFAGKYVIESATLIPIKPELEVRQPPLLDREFNLMPLVDVDRDVQRGAWTINKNTLYSPERGGRI